MLCIDEGVWGREGGGGRSREISAILARDRVVWVRLNWGKKIEI